MAETDSPTGKSTRVISLSRVLVYVGLVGLLVGFLMPEFSCRPPKRSNRARATKEIQDIKSGMENFRSYYGRWPVPVVVTKAANPDFTFGTYETAGEQGTNVLSDSKRRYQANNSALMFILMSEEHPVYNPHFANNPEKKVFLRPTPINDRNGPPGIGPDRVYRDPWGNPYIISLDMDGDGWTQDAFYSLTKVSGVLARGPKGVNGLSSRSGLGTNDFLSGEKIMIWSFGPDGRADPNIGADEGVNQDNIVSWKW